MQQLINAWTGLELRRQIIVVAATVGMFLGIIAMSRMASAPNMTLLYAGLDSSAAGEVVHALEQRGAIFEVRGGAIFVDSADRDRLRMTLASEGMPANTNQGYELLDNLSGFGTTSQMFDAAYWRAKEGELARTIVSSPYISMARVHIASTSGNPFQRSVTPTASVSITPNSPGLSVQQAKAIRFLVASAVSGLSPDDVAVIDANGALVGMTENENLANAGDDKAQLVRERVERLLEARVGRGNAIVEVSVEMVNEAEEIRERRFDPDGRVAISTDTEESTRNSNESAGGDVTVASNLPDGDAGDESSSNSSNSSETRERINYEVSETERSVMRAPGAIKRLTVAVLVNHAVDEKEDGSTETLPRSDEEIEALRELVESAVGYDEDRGDVITIKSMSLKPITPEGIQYNSSFLDSIQIDIMSIIQVAVLAIVTLVLGLFIIRPLLARPPASVSEQKDLIALPQSSEVAVDSFNAESLTDEGQTREIDGPLTEVEKMPELADFSDSENQEDPVERLRSMIGERQSETVETLRNWLEEREEKV